MQNEMQNDSRYVLVVYIVACSGSGGSVGIGKQKE